MKASVFYRIAAVLLLLFAAGHTLGFRQNNPEWGADAVLGLMRAVHFDAQGFTRTYWDFFSAFRLFFSVFLLFAAVLARLLWWTSGRDFGTRAKHCVGARHLLCSSHRFELDIRLHHSARFLNPDYSVFDCGRVALGQVGFHAPIVMVRREDTNCTTTKSPVSGSVPDGSLDLTASCVFAPRV